MFKRKDDLKPFESRVWLASPTMHGEELKYMTERSEERRVGKECYS